MPPNPARRETAERSLFAFGLTYFRHYFMVDGVYQEPPDLHRQLCQELEIALMPNGRLVGALQREGGKSVWGTLILPTYAFARRLKGYAIIFSDTIGKAADKMSDFVMELESNNDLRDDYGEWGVDKDGNPVWLCDFDPLADARGRPVRARDTDLFLRCGARIESLHAMAPVRGKRLRQLRPDLYIFDDPEDDQKVKSDTWRKDFSDWYDGPALGALNSRRGSVIHLGTIVHWDSQLVHLMGLSKGAKAKTKAHWRRLPLWMKDCYGPDGVTPIWPQYWTPERLAFKLSEMGSLRFNMEFRNMPIDPSAQRFKREDFQWYTASDNPMIEHGQWTICDPYDNSRRLPMQVVMGADFAFGEKEHHAYTAYCLMGLLRLSQEMWPRMYVIHMFRDRIGPLAQMDTLLKYVIDWMPTRVGMDANAWQSVFVTQGKAVGIPAVPIQGNGPEAKTVRIDASAVPVERHQVFLLTGAQWAEDFINEAINYPQGLKDQLDAFAYAQMLLAQGAQGAHFYFKQGKSKILQMARGMM